MQIITPQPAAQDRLSWAALYWAGGIGPAGFTRLISSFGSARAALEAPSDDLRAPSLRLSPTQIEAITGPARARLEGMAAEITALESDGIRVLCAFEPGYPAALREAQNPPPVICMTGAITAADEVGLAIVGTREPTGEGRRMARDIARACAERGITVVSGLARGIDTAAHRGALDAGGRTIAVLGSGIRHVHPRRNLRLAGQIANDGAVISEVAPNDAPTGARLMARNRLISVLARGVLAVESTLSGGTLATARAAVMQGRHLFACDWLDDRPQAEGTRALLAEGAEPVLGPDAIDAIEEMLRAWQPPPPPQLSLL